MNIYIAFPLHSRVCQDLPRYLLKVDCVLQVYNVQVCRRLYCRFNRNTRLSHLLLRNEIHLNR